MLTSKKKTTYKVILISVFCLLAISTIYLYSPLNKSTEKEVLDVGGVKISSENFKALIDTQQAGQPFVLCNLEDNICTTLQKNR